MIQGSLFDVGRWWTEMWGGMPEFTQEIKNPAWTTLVHVRSEADYSKFEALAGHVYKSKWAWWPPRKLQVPTLWWAGTEQGGWSTGVMPRYPVYVISKGRWETRLTVKDLERCGVPYHVCVEPQEADKYREVIDPEKVLVLPFSNLGQGSIPARNWVWQHAKETGAERHWILDDNIYGTYRLNRNTKLRAPTGACFRAAEDLVDRYENVAIAGFQYRGFCDQRKIRNPLTLNTRVYSCILIKNDIPYAWRGRYNEDTDLSLCALKDGWATILFNAFLADKVATLQMKGGNTDELYAGTEETAHHWANHESQCPRCDEDKRTFCPAGEEILANDGRWRMAKALVDAHPDVTTIMRKWGRWQHSVDYSRLRDNELVLKPGVRIPDEPNEYGMVLSNRPGILPGDRDEDEDEGEDEVEETQAVAHSGKERPWRTISVYSDDFAHATEFGKLLGQARAVKECWWPKPKLS